MGETNRKKLKILQLLILRNSMLPPIKSIYFSFMFTKVEKNVQTIHDTLDVLSHACYKFHTLKQNICDDKN